MIFEDDPLESSRPSKKRSSGGAKTAQPQRLRKVADGLLEFERYADRKKRLESIEKKNKEEANIKSMNL